MRVGKSMNWRGDRVVKVVDRCCALEPRSIEQIRKLSQLGHRLRPQRTEEMTVVDSRDSGGDKTRSALEIERNGNDRRCAKLSRDAGPTLAEELEKHVAAERHTREHDGYVRVLA